MAWTQLNLSDAHVSYAVLAFFAAIFGLGSSYVKDRVYLGESVLGAVYGLIVGPHCLNFFVPTSWTANSFKLTLELSRVIICLDIFSVGVQLPNRYMKTNLWSVLSLLIPTMVIGWLIIGAFIYLLFPNLAFTHGLLISAAITATDPVLATAVVGGGKFGRKVPEHLRNLLLAESACNDGLAVPFVYLSLNLVLHSGHPAEIAKQFICVAVLWQCVFGLLFGAFLGYIFRKLIQYCCGHRAVDQHSLLASYITVTFFCTGLCSMLGADDLLACFGAGSAFAWDGWINDNTEDSDASSVLDLLLNICYFVYLGAIIPWAQFNMPDMGLSVWRMVVLGIVVILLRRIPAVLLIQPICPDIKSWKEAIFVAHFGPIGVGAVYGSILAISEIEAHVLGIEHGPVAELPGELGDQYYYILHSIWPIVCFLIVVSIIVHGLSPPIMMLVKSSSSKAHLPS